MWSWDAAGRHPWVAGPGRDEPQRENRPAPSWAGINATATSIPCDTHQAVPKKQEKPSAGQPTNQTGLGGIQEGGLGKWGQAGDVQTLPFPLMGPDFREEPKADGLCSPASCPLGSWVWGLEKV